MKIPAIYFEENPPPYLGNVNVEEAWRLYNTDIWRYGISKSYQTISGDSLVPITSGNLKQVSYLSNANNIDVVNVGEYAHSYLYNGPEPIREILRHLIGPDTFPLSRMIFWDKKEKGFDGASLKKIFFTCSPIRLLVEDSSGNRVGQDLATGEVINEIANAHATGPEEAHQWIILPAAPQEHYTVRTAVTEVGPPYDIGVIFAGDNGDLAIQAFTGPATEAGVNYDFTFREPVLPVVSDEVTVHPRPQY